jgi:hypothetical protein
LRRPARVVARSLSLAAFVGSAAFVACQLAFPTALLTEATPDASMPVLDAGADAQGTDSIAPVESGPRCGVSVPPPPATPPSVGQQEIMAAVKTIYYAEDAGPIAALGYDLDCVDTCPGPPSCNSPQQNCDLSGGRDLAANFFVQTVENFEATTAGGDINSIIALGKVGFIVWLSGYNGEANDSQVVLSTIVSTGIVADPEAGTRSPPKWDGTDVWSVDPASVVGPPIVNDAGYHYTPSVVATGAYVTNNTLVASVSGIPIQLGVGTVTLTHGYVVAKITPLPGIGYRLDGQLIGRVTTRSILGILAAFKDPLDPTQYLCGKDPTFQAFRMSFCNSADIMYDPARDRTDASCDSLSAAIGFVAISGTLGAEFPQDTFVPGCDGGIEDCEQ